MAFNAFGQFMRPNPVAAPTPMAPTMGTAIRGMFGGQPMSGPGWAGQVGGIQMNNAAPRMPTMGQGIGQAVRDLAQAPNRTGGIGQQVRAITPSMPVLQRGPSPTAVPFRGRRVNSRRGIV